MMPRVDISVLMSSTFPRMIVRRLLKSWATPPAKPPDCLHFLSLEKLFLKMPHFAFCFALLGDVANRLDGPANHPFFIAQEGCDPPKMGSLGFMEQGNEGFPNECIASSFKKCIFFFDFLSTVKSEVNERGAAAAIKWDGIFLVAAAEHLAFFLSRYL